MARITIEDCINIVPNRFELCLIAINRAKSIASGSPTLIESEDKEKPAVLSLREIAGEMIDIDNVRKDIMKIANFDGIVEDDQFIDNEDNNLVDNTIDSSSESTLLTENLEVND